MTPGEFASVKSFALQKQARSALLVSKKWDITFHETTGRGSTVLRDGVSFHNISIARALFFPDQLGYSDTGTGSFAKAKVHLGVFLWPLNRLHRDMEEVHNEQIIKPMVDMNWGAQTAYPRLTFGELTDEQKVQWFTSVMEALKHGALGTPGSVDLDIQNAIRKHLELAEKEKEDEEKAGGSPIAGKETPDTETPENATVGDGDSPAKLQAYFERHARQLRPLTTYEKKVDVGGIVKFINVAQDQFVKTWADLMQDNLNNLIKYTRDTGLVIEAEWPLIDDLRLYRVSEQRKSLQRYMLVSLYFGALQAQREIERARKGNFETEQSTISEFAEVDISKLPLTEVEKYFESLGLVTTKPIKTSASYIKSKAFRITNIENDTILGQAKRILYRGIERSDQVWTEGQLRRLFDPYLKTGELTDAKLGQAWRLEVIARNNFTTSINQGRKAVFTDPDVDQFVEAYQWSAVLDDATTDYCSSLDGRVLRKEEVDTMGWPPAHHNCRSLVVPIVQGEKFTFDKIPAGITRGVGFEHKGCAEVLH
jgi:SPP1 gp7 family putative phage head morphogenesis protein